MYFHINGVGSSILAALADGPLLIGDIVAFLVASGCATVLIVNWGTISRNWSDITAAFELSFNTLISSTTIGSSFTKSKTSYETPYNEMMAGRSVVHYAQVSRSAARHIDMSFVESVVRNNSALRVFVSHSRQSALLVYRTNSSNRANVNFDFAHRNSENTGTYQNTNYLILIECSDTMVNTSDMNLFEIETSYMERGISIQYVP